MVSIMPAVLRLVLSWARPTDPASLIGDNILVHALETAGPCILAEAMAPGKEAWLSLPVNTQWPVRKIIDRSSSYTLARVRV